jgi:hypothetical protein
MPRPRPSADYTKTCSLCGETKLSDQFNSAPTSRDGLQSRCKVCQNKLYTEYRKANPDKRREQHAAWRSQQPMGDSARRAREWRKRNPERAKDHDLKRTRRLPLGTYARMLAEHRGRCAICGTDRPNGMGRFHVDHCHATDAIRGILCSNCNLLIGHAKDRVDLLGAAIAYLNKYSTD